MSFSIRSFVSIICFGIACANALHGQSQQVPKEIQSYVDYLNSHSFESPKDYVLDLFEENDIVILVERHHGDITQYELVLDILRDKRFNGNVYTEIGNSSRQEKLNQFLSTTYPNAEKKRELLLDLYQNLHDGVTWDKYNNYYLIDGLHEINQERDGDGKIKIFPLDDGFDWEKIISTDQYRMYYDFIRKRIIKRDLLMGENFITYYEQEKEHKKKALVILNLYHGYIKVPKYTPHPNRPIIYSTAEYIYKYYPKSTKNVLLNSYIFDVKPKLIAQGIWDAAFEFTGNKNVGFDMKNTPFGNTTFDMYEFGAGYEQVTFSYMFDGYIFYKPIKEFKVVLGIPGLFESNQKEYYRRMAIERGMSIEEAMKDGDGTLAQELYELTTKREVKLRGYDGLMKQINEWFEDE